MGWSCALQHSSVLSSKWRFRCAAFRTFAMFAYDILSIYIYIYPYIYIHIYIYISIYIYIYIHIIYIPYYIYIHIYIPYYMESPDFAMFAPAIPAPGSFRDFHQVRRWTEKRVA